MKVFTRILLTMSFVLGLMGFTMAATTPDLGDAGSFGILSSTFTYNGGVTSVGGDLAFTSPGGGGTYTVVGSVFTPAPSQAGLDQNAARAFLDAQACDFTFAPGPIDLASDTTHGSIGVYTSGVYCVIGAMSINSTPGIILSGGGTFIFRSSGAFSTAPNMIVALTGGTSSCNVFWTPGAATTLGANTTFLGIIIDAAGITIGANSTLLGSALSFGGTITTDIDTISVPSCAITPVVIVPPVVPVVPIIDTGTIEPIVAPVVIPPVTPPLAPGFPTTGIAPQESTSLGSIAFFVALFIIASGLFFVVLRKRTV